MQLDDLNKQRAKNKQQAVASPKAPTAQKATAAPAPAPAPAPAVMPHKDPAYDLPGSGNPVYKSEAELRAALDAGVIKPEQYTAAAASLQKYGTAVDPLGFGNPKPQGEVDEMGNPLVRNDSTNDPLPNADQQKPTAQPLQSVPPLTGADLKTAADKRRNQRLAERGIAEADFQSVNEILKQGGRIAGTENGQAMFLMPDGSKRYSPVNENATRSAIEIAGTDYSKEVTDENKKQNDMLHSQQVRQNMSNQENKQETQKGEKSPTDTTTSTATADIDATIASLTTMSQNAMGISQDVFNAYLPSILGKLAKIKELRAQAETMDTVEEQTAMVDADPVVASATATAALREKQFDERLKEQKRIMEKNQEIALEANSLATESLELDKKIIEERNREDETRKMAANVEGEKQLRRSLNSAGIETSPLAQDYLQRKITEAADSLATMRQTNNLTILKFDVARKELANGVVSILSEFDSQRASLYATHDDNIFNLDQFVSGSRSSAYKEVQEKLGKLVAEEDKLYREAGDKIAEMGIKAVELQQKEEEKSKKEQMGTKDKLGFVQSLRSGINQNKTITQANDVDGFYGAVNAGYNRYAQILKDIKEGKLDPKKGEAALGPSQSAVIGSLARILDPGSVVRNEEYERQTLGSSFVNRVAGYWEKIQAGGAGVTATDIQEMKTLADKLHESWEGRLQQSMQPFILDIQDWNTNYPDAQINFAQVIPVDRIHLPTATMDSWRQQSGFGTADGAPAYGTSPVDTSKGFAKTGAPAKGWRTDRHNNPIAFAVKAGGTNEFTDALDASGIAWEHGDAFPESDSMVTVRVLGDPVEASRVVLANSKALQNWYLQPGRPYANTLKRFNIRNNADFAALPVGAQNDIIATIYKGEVGDGSLIASMHGGSSISTSADDGYDEISFQNVGIDDDPIAAHLPKAPIRATGSVTGPGMVMGSGGQQQIPLTAIKIGKYKTKEGGIIQTRDPKQIQQYNSRPDLFTPVS